VTSRQILAPIFFFFPLPSLSAIFFKGVVFYRARRRAGVNFRSAVSLKVLPDAIPMAFVEPRSARHRALASRLARDELTNTTMVGSYFRISRNGMLSRCPASTLRGEVQGSPGIVQRKIGVEVAEAGMFERNDPMFSDTIPAAAISKFITVGAEGGTSPLFECLLNAGSRRAKENL